MEVFYSFRKKDIGCLVSSRITETYNDVVAGMFNIESNLVSHFRPVKTLYPPPSMNSDSPIEGYFAGQIIGKRQSKTGRF